MNVFVRKNACLVLCTLLLISALLCPGVRAESSQVRTGDVNGDQTVDVADVARLYAHFQGNSLVGQDAMNRADINNSGWLLPSYTGELYDQIRGLSPRDLRETLRQLPEGAQMSDEVTMTGRVVDVIDPYNPTYHNITVSIRVDGWQEPVICYRMVGDRIETLCRSMSVTVTGTLMNDGGKAKFSAGCRGVINAQSNTPDSYAKYIMSLVNDLPVNASSGTELSLSGRVIAIEPISPDSSEITLTIQLEGFEDTPIRCCNMVGEGINRIRIGASIGVSGIVRNSNGMVEFAPGCRLVGVGI